jgi:hypothetical protein
VVHYKYIFLRFHCFGCRWYLLEHDAGRVRNSCPIMAPGKTYVECFFPTFWIKSEPIIHIESCLTSLLTMARDLHRDEDSTAAVQDAASLGEPDARAQVVQMPRDTSEDEHDDKDADGGAAPQTETDAEPRVVPMPTIEEDTPYGNGEKVACFFPGCPSSRTTCRSLLSHIQQVHPGYKKTPREWKETFFIKKANEEKSAIQKARRMRHPPQKKDKSGTKSAASTREGGSASTSAASATPLVPSDQGTATTLNVTTLAQRTNPIRGATTVQLVKPSESGSQASTMYVPIGSYDALLGDGLLEQREDGVVQWNPDVPLHVQRDKLLAALPLHQSTRLSQLFKQSMSVEQAQPIVPSGLMSIAETDGGAMAMSSAPPHVVSLMREMRNIQQLLAKHVSGAPQADIQKLTIKADMENWQRPKEWNDQKRHYFPFHVTPLEHDAFSKYLEARDLAEDTCEKHLAHMARFLFMLEAIDDTQELDIVNVLVNAYYSGVFHIYKGILIYWGILL